MTEGCFTNRDLKLLAMVGKEGYPVATKAVREIEQLNNYVYALECALMFGFPKMQETKRTIEKLRGHYAPDLQLPEINTDSVEEWIIG